MELKRRTAKQPHRMLISRKLLIFDKALQSTSSSSFKVSIAQLMHLVYRQSNYSGWPHIIQSCYIIMNTRPEQVYLVAACSPVSHQFHHNSLCAFTWCYSFICSSRSVELQQLAVFAMICEFDILITLQYSRIFSIASSCCDPYSATRSVSATTSSFGYLL